jgi:DNA-binding response OmpR family regulator
MDIFKAVLSLQPDAKFSLTGNEYENLIWFAENEFHPPSKEEVLEEAQKLQQEYENNQYQRNRAKEYPSIQEQLDTLYHQGYDGWKATIDEVKNKFPKPLDTSPHMPYNT